MDILWVISHAVAQSCAPLGFPPAGFLPNKNIRIKWCDAKLWGRKNFIFSQFGVNHCVLIELWVVQNERRNNRKTHQDNSFPIEEKEDKITFGNKTCQRNIH